MSRLLLSLLCLLFCNSLHAQLIRKALFLGNSYTGVNNLPLLISDVATSAGDSLVYDSYTPGGYQLVDHQIDPVSQSKITTGGWDYIVLQGQSQEPITHSSQFTNGGIMLNNLISQNDPCSVVMLYMTWGRKNGDAANCPNFPVMCTYSGMDSTLRNKYTELATKISAEVSPVSVVWNYLRTNHPGIELYHPDESHPSLAGSYAAACTFYTAIFKKDPTLITYNPGLNATDASAIRNAVKTMVFNTPANWDFTQAPQSAFNYYTGSGFNEVNFLKKGYAESYLWNFGDGSSSTSPGPVHSYATDGTYQVTLTAYSCDLQGLDSTRTDTVIEFCAHTPTIFSANPWICQLDTLYTQTADSIQWYFSGQPLPEYNQFLADYYQYGISPFSVKSTVNGCTELSVQFGANPEWPGYYFDIFPGDPCEGDTLPMMVLHFSGALNGQETIYWYRNDSLLVQFNGQDTLWISDPGIYRCEVINPLSDCPFDTTRTEIDFTCAGMNITQTYPATDVKVYPNPSAGKLTILLADHQTTAHASIFDVNGRLVMKSVVSDGEAIDISSLSPGFYILRLNNSEATAGFIRY